MAESEVSSLREALRNQYITISKLYVELEEERKASASAADEALSMILRLQAEKATEKMEASQYKRIAEEKMQYAEQSLAFLQEILNQKDLEIEFLKHQVMAYEYRLYSTGCENPDIGIVETHDDLSLNRSRAFLGQRHFGHVARRNISLPAIQFENLCSEIGIVDEEQTLLLRENYEEIHLSKRCVLEECSSDPEQAEEVKLKAKEMMQTTSIKERARSVSSLETSKLQETALDETLGFLDSRFCSCCKTLDVVASSGSTLGGTGTYSEGISCSSSDAQDREIEPKCYAPNPSCLETESNSGSIQDIGEVPKGLHCCIAIESHEQIVSEPISEAKHMTDIHSPSSQKALIIRQDEHLKIDTSPSQTDIEELKERLRQLEDGRKTMRHEDSEMGKEQLKLLQKIQEQLDTIQLHVKKLKFKEPRKQEDPMFISLVEAMLYFSI